MEEKKEEEEEEEGEEGKTTSSLSPGYSYTWVLFPFTTHPPPLTLFSSPLEMAIFEHGYTSLAAVSVSHIFLVNEGAHQRRELCIDWGLPGFAARKKGKARARRLE